MMCDAMSFSCERRLWDTFMLELICNLPDERSQIQYPGEVPLEPEYFSFLDLGLRYTHSLSQPSHLYLLQRRGDRRFCA